MTKPAAPYLPGGTYLRRLTRLALAGKLTWENLHTLACYHDPWCGSLRQSTCDCDPIITLEGVRVEVDDE